MIPNEILGGRTRWLALFLVLLSLTLIIGTLGMEEEVPTDVDLEIDEVYFLRTDEDNTTADLDIIVFITNHGNASIDEVEVRAFVVEDDSNLARARSEIDMGSIDSTATEEGRLTVEVPRDNEYRIELLVFTEGKLAIRGSGSAVLSGSGYATSFRTIDENSTPGKGSADGPGNILSITGWMILILTATFFATMIALRKGSAALVNSRERRSERDRHHIEMFNRYQQEWYAHHGQHSQQRPQATGADVSQDQAADPNDGNQQTL